MISQSIIFCLFAVVSSSVVYRDEFGDLVRYDGRYDELNVYNKRNSRNDQRDIREPEGPKSRDEIIIRRRHKQMPANDVLRKLQRDYERARDNFEYARKSTFDSSPPLAGDEQRLDTRAGPPGRDEQALDTRIPPPGRDEQALDARVPPPGRDEQALDARIPPPGRDEQALDARVPPPGRDEQALDARKPPPGRDEQAVDTRGAPQLDKVEEELDGQKSMKPSDTPEPSDPSNDVENLKPSDTPEPSDSPKKEEKKDVLKIEKVKDIANLKPSDTPEPSDSPKEESKKPKDFINVISKDETKKVKKYDSLFEDNDLFEERQHGDVKGDVKESKRDSKKKDDNKNEHEKDEKKFKSKQEKGDLSNESDEGEIRSQHPLTNKRNTNRYDLDAQNDRSGIRRLEQKRRDNIINSLSRRRDFFAARNSYPSVLNDLLDYGIRRRQRGDEEFGRADRRRQRVNDLLSRDENRRQRGDEMFARADRRRQRGDALRRSYYDPYGNDNMARFKDQRGDLKRQIIMKRQRIQMKRENINKNQANTDRKREIDTKLFSY